MADTAGFDVLVQIPRGTVTDLVDLVPIPVFGPAPMRLFGGPYVWSGPPVGPGGVAQLVSARARVRLEVVAGTDVTRLVADLDDIVVHVGPLHAAGLTATVVAEVSVGCATETIAGETWVVPVLRLASARVSASVPTPWGGITLADQNEILSNLTLVVTRNLAAAHDVAVVTEALRVVPGVDSHDARTLTAVPEVRWIDAETLGVFGYFHAAAAGGDPARPTAGTLTTPEPEYVYPRNGPDRVLSARRSSLTLSARGFALLGAWTAVHAVTLELLVTARTPEFVELVRTVSGAAIGTAVRAQLHGAWLAEAVAARTDGITGPATDAERRTVDDRLAAETDRRIRAHGAASCRQFLTTTVDGTATVVAAMPPPSGTGRSSPIRPCPPTCAASTSSSATAGSTDSPRSRATCPCAARSSRPSR